MFKDIIAKIDKLEPLVKLTGNKELESMAKFLYDRVQHPDSYLVIMGETSSGKSSIINGLIGEAVLPMKANPSTAAITEVELIDSSKEPSYFAINRDASIELIDRPTFDQLGEHPDAELQRLKVQYPIRNTALRNVRIFDTPGYGSIIDAHDEVLKEFLPNSDVIVYVVDYAVGIQEEDYLFLSYLRELIRSEVKIILMVNRCPEGLGADCMKVRKLASAVSDILTIDPQVFTIPRITGVSGHVLPHSEALWAYVADVLAAPERTTQLHNAFEAYVADLYHLCMQVVETRYIASLTSMEEYNQMRTVFMESAARIRAAIYDILMPTFERIGKVLPCKVTSAKERVIAKLAAEIKDTNRFEKEDMVGYINAHLLPYTIKTEASEIQTYMNVELTALNKELDDYLQKEYVRFNSEISITLSSNTSIAASTILSKFLSKSGESALQSYFVAFGGMGGANAGIANAASHFLKVVGDKFGHTFSQATHNGLKHFLKKIGATSMRAVGAATAVVTELLFEAVDLFTWKPIARQKIKSAMNKWEEKTTPELLADLKKLETANVDTIYKLAYEQDHTFDDMKPQDVEKAKADYYLGESIGKEIGIA